MTSSIHETLGLRHEVDPAILKRIQAREARLPADDDIETEKLPEQGTYILLEPEQPGNRSALGVIKAAMAGMLTNERFNVDNPEESLRTAIIEGNSRIQGGAYEPTVSGVAVRVFHDGDKKLHAVVASFGKAYAYIWQKGWMGRNGISPVTQNNENVALDGIPRADDTVKVNEVSLKTGDRIAMVSEDVDRTMHLNAVTAQEISDQLRRESSTDLAAQALVGSEPDGGQAIGNRDRVAIVLDVLRSRLEGTAHTIGPLAAGATVGAASVPFWRKWNQQRSPAGQTSEGFWRHPRRTAEYIRDRRERERANNLTWRDRAGGWTTVGLASLGAVALARRKKYHDKHIGDPVYQDRTIWADDEMIHRDIERRRARRVGLALGGVALTVILGKVFHADIVPSVFDGDGFDLTPWHGSSPHHAAFLGDPRDGKGISGFFGFILDDDTPTFPKLHGHSAANIPAPRAPYLGNAPGTGGSGPGGTGSGGGNPPLPQNPRNAPGSNYDYDLRVAKQPFVVENDSGIIREIKEYYEQVVGHAPPQGLADRIYFDRPASIGNNMINLPTYKGPTPGDIRIGTPSTHATWTPGFADYVAKEVSEYAA